jgi:hypothetical protein
MSRRVHAVLGAVVLLAAFFSLGFRTGCSDATTAPKLAGEPCTRTSECASGLECGGGVCRAISDASVDGGDASGDAAIDAP